MESFVKEDVFTRLPIRQQFLLNWLLMKKIARSEKRILMAVFELVGGSGSVNVQSCMSRPCSSLLIMTQMSSAEVARLVSAAENLSC